MLAVAALCAVCTKDYNPFADLTNAKVHVLSWSFSGRDSVALYATGTLKTVVALREDVDSFSVAAPKNRFWADTTVRKTSQGAAIDGGPYSFSISFYDTGVQTVTVSTYRSNGEVLPEHFSVRVFSPLRQDTIKGLFGAVVTLSTLPVPDKDVFYHWNFGGGRKDSSVSGSSAVLFTYFTPTTGNGSLLVTDLSGNHPTPICTFQYQLIDTTPPVIMCVDSGLKNDTLVTGDSLFAFRAYVADAGNARVDSCTVNRTTFDFANFSTQVYTKLFRNLPDLTKGNVPLAVTVFARDNAQFKNMAQRTFWVVFNPLGVKSADAQIDFKFPLKDSSIAQNRTFQIFGNAQNFRGDPMFLTVKVNDSLYPATRTIPDSGGDWEWELHLNTVVNKVIVSAYSTDSRFITSSQRVIYYDPNALDSIKPMLYSITVNDKQVNNFYTPDSFVTLKIVAFDQGSGIQAMYLNSDKISQDSAGYIWHVNSGKLVHRLQGNSMFIRAIDNAGNIKDSTVTIFKNSPPDTANPGILSELCIESSYMFHLPLFDADGDSVTIIKVWAPASMDISKIGTISWKPAVADTGLDSLVIQLYDQYQASPLMSPKFYVRNCSQPILPVHFTTTVQDFPVVMQAGVDTLKIKLTVDSARASSLLYYKAWLIDNNQVIKANDTSSLLVWAPGIADTGFRRFMVTVGDGASAFDTLSPAIQVVPINQYPCSLSCRFTGTTTAAGNLDIFSHPAAETLYFTIIDKDNPLTEKYTVTISQHNVNSVEVLNKKDFFVAIKPDSTRILDTLRVSIRDLTNTTDSARFVIQYDSARTNTPPALLGDPGFPAYACADSSYQFHVSSYDPDNDIVTVAVLHAPAGMTVSAKGLVQWAPAMSGLGQDSLVVRFYDQHDYSIAYRWTLQTIDCSKKPPPVKFQTQTSDFPKILHVGADSIALQLQTVAGTGARPFSFYTRFMDNGAVVLDDTIGRLVWKPQIADTGYHVMMVSVKDKYTTADSISPAFNVVQRNQFPCSLSFTFTGTRTTEGYLDMYSHPAPETLYFTIKDQDNPLTESYTVTIIRNNISTVQTMTTKAFSVVLFADPLKTIDTLRVSVHDMTNTTDSATIIVEYRNPTSLPFRLYLNTTSSGAGIGANVLKFPVLVRLTKYNFDFSLAQGGGENIRFRKSSGTELPYQIEKWDSAAALACVWVLADTVYGNDSSHYFELYQIGRPAVDGSNAAAVFDTVNSFRGVWHLGENALTIHDATADGFDGTRTGNQQPDTGIIGTCQTFDGLNSYTDMGNVLDPGNSNFTASVWVKRGGNIYSELVGKSTGGSPNADYGWLLDFDGNNKVHCFMATASGQWGGAGIFDIYSDAAVTDLTQWHYICAVINRSSSTVCKLYIDGAEAASTSRGSITNVGNIRNNVAFRIGAEADNEINFNGSIDEAAVSFTARGTDWIRLCYMNQKAADVLVRIK